jgi:hypothetical protein
LQSRGCRVFPVQRFLSLAIAAFIIQALQKRLPHVKMKIDTEYFSISLSVLVLPRFLFIEDSWWIY